MPTPKRAPEELITAIAVHCRNITIGDIRLRIGPEGFTILHERWGHVPSPGATICAEDMDHDGNLWFLCDVFFAEWEVIPASEQESWENEPELDLEEHCYLYGFLRALFDAKRAYDVLAALHLEDWNEL